MAVIFFSFELGIQDIFHTDKQALREGRVDRLFGTLAPAQTGWIEMGARHMSLKARLWTLRISSERRGTDL